MKPITRKEAFLAKIAGEDVTIEPKTYDEIFLNAIAEKRGGEDVELPQPNTMEQAYLKKIAESISGGGGGGSSDFSVAEVTLTNVGESEIRPDIPVAFDENEAGEGAPAMMTSFRLFGIFPKESKELKVPLYKGSAFINMGSATIETTGSIVSMGAGAYLITGDCTISCSAPK